MEEISQVWYQVVVFLPGKPSKNGMTCQGTSGSWDVRIHPELYAVTEVMLLMVQKSGVNQLRLVVSPIICKVLAPSQVVSRISSINSI